MNTIAILVGIAFVAIAVCALAGLWWGVLFAGVVLVAGGVLGEVHGLLGAEPEKGVRQ